MSAEAKWVEVQKKAFTHFVNTYLSKRNLEVQNLQEDLKDGVNLIRFVELLTGRELKEKWHRNPKMRVHFIENCHLGITFVKKDPIVSNVTISAEDFVDGNLKMILGFCWQMLCTFASIKMEGAEDKSFEDALLMWVRKKVEDYDIEIKNFSSFTDGKALLALCHSYDENLIDYDGMDKADPMTNVKEAFAAAEKGLNVPQLLDATELVNGDVGEKQMVLYLSLFHNAFASLDELKKAESGRKSLREQISELQSQLDATMSENSELSQSKLSLEEALAAANSELDSEKVKNAALSEENDQLKSELGDLKNELSALREKETYLEEKVNTLQELLEQETSEKTELQSKLDDRDARIAALERELERIKEERDGLVKEKEELRDNNDELMDALERMRRSKEEFDEQVKEQQELETRGLDELRKHMLQHLGCMNTWKDYLEQDREYESEKIQQVEEARIRDASFEDQLEALKEALERENESLEALLASREAEEAAAAKG